MRRAYAAGMKTSTGNSSKTFISPKTFLVSQFIRFAIYCVSLSALLLLVAPSREVARGAEPVKVAMTADRWQITGEGEFQQYKGMEALSLKKGAAMLNGLTFRNGTIEFDVVPLQMGAGIGFRWRDKDTYEYIYLRPSADCVAAGACIQYAPTTQGVLLWDLFPQYQSAATLHDGDWNHVKMVVSGQRMNVYVNGVKTPTLKIGRLEGDTMEGALTLQAPGYFANLTVVPDAVEGLASEPEKDPTTDDRRLVRNWQVAPASELAADKEPGFSDMPDSSAAWQSITAERGGLVDITRLYGMPLPRPRRSITWLKTTIKSDKNQSIKTAIGWSREVWLFVNGKPIYADKNLYQPPTARKAPDGRCSLENG